MSATDSIRPASHEARGCGRQRRLSATWNRVALLVFLAAFLAPLAWPSAAGAGPSRYVFEMCDSVLPGGGVAGVIRGAHPRLPFGLEDSCAQPNGALVVRQPAIGARDGGEASWGVPMRAPSGTSFESLSITGTSCASWPSVGTVFLSSGWPPVTCQPDMRSFRLKDEFKGFSVSLRCIDYSLYDNEHCNAGPWVSAQFFAATIADTVPPALSEPSGSLLEAGVRRGRQSIGVVAADNGGGLSGVFLTANGLPVGQPRTLNCNVAQADNPSVKGTVAAQVTPCPTAAEAKWIVDTGAYPFRDGANTVQVCASDFSTLSDPNTTCSAPRAIGVDGSCAESPVAGGEVLSAQFERSNAEQVTVGFGKSAAVIGRLANNAGDPIPGATLCMKMQTIGVDRVAATVGSVKTDANGRYRYEVAPGPNREVVVGYRHDTAQVAREVRYYAHARPSLRVSKPRVANGKRVRFWGQLPGPNGGGRVVVLQAGTVGSKRWITFRRATADERGVFRAGYRFSSTSHRTKYHFRAVVPRQAGYPWVEGHSKPVEVLVRP